MNLKICHLYPDLLNLYGDTGNILCLKRRLEWRGIDAEVTPLPVGESADFTKFDMFFVGGGQDFELEVLMDDLRKGKDREIVSAVEDGKVFLAVCGGYQMLGQYFKTAAGVQYDFIGALNMHTLGSESRMTGDYMFRCGEKSGGSTVVGFENHSGRTYLDSGVEPLGKVLSGFGNNGEDGSEGARYKNVFGTYAHGPLLPKNPEFADMLLLTALRLRTPDAELSPLSDGLEMMAHGYMENRLK